MRNRSLKRSAKPRARSRHLKPIPPEFPVSHLSLLPYHIVAFQEYLDT
jgi:hypothetical protein